MRASSSSESTCSSRSASSWTSSMPMPSVSREVQLEQPVVADHLERDLLAVRGQRDAAVRRRARRARAPPASSPSRSRTRARRPAARRARTSTRGRRPLRACRSPSGSPGSSPSARAPRRECRAGSRRGSRRTLLASPLRMRIRLGHSPDPDDAFMFWAPRRRAGSTRAASSSSRCSQDIQTLNAWALEGRLEVTAISLATYPFVQDRYALLPHGASMGSGYGPVVVAREPLDARRPRATSRSPCPGALTTAFLALRLVLGDVRATASCRSSRSRTRSRRRRGRRRAVIHEGQLTYEDCGPHEGARPRRVVAAGDGLPLPLGVNVARRDLGAERLRELSGVLARGDPVPGSTTARRRSSTRSSSGAASTPRARRPLRRRCTSTS